MAVRVKTQLTRDDLVRASVCRAGLRAFCDRHRIHTATALPTNVLLRFARVSGDNVAESYIQRAANLADWGEGTAYGDSDGMGDGEGDDDGVDDDVLNDTFTFADGDGYGGGDYGYSFDGNGCSGDRSNDYGGDNCGSNIVGDGGFF